MQLSYQWLTRWVDSGLGPAEAGERLTLAGLELEEILPAAPVLDQVLCGRILSAEPHPDADRLQLCTVDVGAAEALQIVCGAPNARAGLGVAVAMIGCRLPGGLKIKRSKIRGVESHGMLCSGGELGLDETPGILELPADCPPGPPLAEALQLDDHCLDIALTPNRGDCLSLRGIARELACLSARPWSLPDPRPPVAASLPDRHGIRIEDGRDCRRYAGRIIRGLDRSVATPLWMAERLRRSGLRSINPLVDVTNYVMIELGQPMHAFDLARLNGDILVRRARAGEALTLLNGQDIELGGEELLITDDSGPIALAGAMGGLATAVTDSTTDVLLESACFSPGAVAGTGRKFKLSSDSLHRFERGVDPCLQEQALERACALLIEIAGGQAGPSCLTEAAAWQAPQIPLRPPRLRQLLGADIADQRIREVLEQLECQVESEGETWTVRAPSHRYDLAAEIDLVEEVARIVGYDSLRAGQQTVPATLRAAPLQSPEQRAAAVLSARGYYEAISYSFVDPHWDELLSGEEASNAIAVDNPMSVTQAQMRRSLWSSLLPIWLHNAQRQQERIRLFESGREYRREGTRIVETEIIAGLASGPVWPEQWAAPRRPVDFYDLKADLLALLGRRADESLVFDPAAAHPALHPGRSAGLRLNGQVCGYLGQLHPGLQKRLQLPQAPWLFSLQRQVLENAPAIRPPQLGDTPSTRRDLALLVDQALAADKLINYVNSSAVPGLRELRIFDVFTGDALPKGFKSVALGLIFQDFSRTLTDTEVDEAVAALASGLEREFGAQIRD